MAKIKTIMAGVLALAATLGVASAQEQVPEGRLYAFHSKAQGGCPALDWHVVAGTDNQLSGIIGWNDMKDMARVSGSANPRQHTFQMTGVRVGGQGAGATITGQIRQDGWLIANIKGPNVNCQGVAVPWYTPPQGAGAG